MGGPLTRPPSIDSLLVSAEGQQLVSQFGRSRVTRVLQDHVTELRTAFNAGSQPLPSTAELLAAVAVSLIAQDRITLRPVLNLTGTVLHTNLGRAALPRAALLAAIDTAAAASNLEFDIESGSRGDRDHHIESLLTELTGAEAATVVNNNAAAVLLVLNTLAQEREVPVSRGELVEIGGSFRIPDIMSRSGCHLVEIGSTNRTHLTDYRDAIGKSTALLMKVHTSNYEIRGFTKAVSDAAVAELAHAAGLPFVTDLGSGSLIDLTSYGLPDEPTVRSTIEAGADIVTFSGDKLLGGPQAGIIVGTREYIDRIKHNPMKRALRVDKLTVAVLFEVLKLYRDPDSLIDALPTLRYLTRSSDDLARIADELLAPIANILSGIADVSIQDTQSQIGSGSMPLNLLPSKAICIAPKSSSDTFLRALALCFRRLPLPMIGRVNDGKLLFDLRTLDDTADVVGQLDQFVAPEPAP